MTDAQIGRASEVGGGGSTRRRDRDDGTRALGLVAAIGFGVLVVLLVLLAVTEENLVGTAAGLVGIVTGICLGLFLRRTEPPPDGVESTTADATSSAGTDVPDPQPSAPSDPSTSAAT